MMSAFIWYSFHLHSANFWCSYTRDVQDCQQRLSSTFDLLLIFLCSLIQTLTLTPPPNNALLAILDMYDLHSANFWCSPWLMCIIACTPSPYAMLLLLVLSLLTYITACTATLIGGRTFKRKAPLRCRSYFQQRTKFLGPKFQ